MNALRNQYERYPYPPVGFLALPRRNEGKELRYPRAHEGIRILIAGCGTLETTVVAQNHGRAMEIVSVDLSERSMEISEKRLGWMKIARPLSVLPPVRWIAGDLQNLHLANSIYIGFQCSSPCRKSCGSAQETLHTPQIGGASVS